MAAHPAAEVHEMDGDLVAVPIDEVADLVDVGGGAGGGVHVDDEVVPGGCGEDAVQLGAAGGVRWMPAEQEAQLQRLHALLSGQCQGVLGPLGVLWAW